MATTTVYLVRHGEAGEQEQGDPGLTDLGRSQAASVGAALVDRGAQEVLHGSRRRSVETATIVADVLGVALRTSPACEDRTPLPVDWAVVPGEYHAFLRSVPPEEADLGGRLLDESLAALGATGASDRTIVVVTHNFVIGWFVRSVLDAPWSRWIGLNSGNGAVTAIRWEPGRSPRLLCFNEQGHLR